jgi:hypothetical protein
MKPARAGLLALFTALCVGGFWLLMQQFLVDLCKRSQAMQAPPEVGL